MALVLIFPSDREQPAEYASNGDCLRCRACGLEVDEDSDECLRWVTIACVNGSKRQVSMLLCDTCLPSCDECGDKLDDDSLAACDLGPVVAVPQYELDGKRATGHAVCIADRLLQVWSEDRWFDIDRASKEEIAGVVAKAFAKGVAA